MLAISRPLLRSEIEELFAPCRRGRQATAQLGSRGNDVATHCRNFQISGSWSRTTMPSIARSPSRRCPDWELQVETVENGVEAVQRRREARA